MKQLPIQKQVLILAVLAVFMIVGCKSGSTFKMENPFSRKPKAPSKATPKEIDGLHLSAPPEKYTKELTKNESTKGKSSDKSLAQKGKYETFPSSKEMKIDYKPEIAMNPGAAQSTSPIPNYSSTASTPQTAPSTANTAPQSVSTWPSPTYGPGVNSNTNPSGQTAPSSFPTPQSYPGTSPNSMPAAQSYPGTQAVGAGVPQSYPGTTAGTNNPGGSYPSVTVPAPTGTPGSTMAPGFAPGSIGGY